MYDVLCCWRSIASWYRRNAFFARGSVDSPFADRILSAWDFSVSNPNSVRRIQQTNAGDVLEMLSENADLQQKLRHMKRRSLRRQSTLAEMAANRSPQQLFLYRTIVSAPRTICLP